MYRLTSVIVVDIKSYFITGILAIRGIMLGILLCLLTNCSCCFCIADNFISTADVLKTHFSVNVCSSFGLHSNHCQFIVSLLSTETFISIIIVINSVNISNTVVYYHQCCHHQENLHLYRHRWYVAVVVFLPYAICRYFIKLNILV